MIVQAAKPDAMQYSLQYELIRSQIIGTVESVTQGGTRGIGLALLLSEGMPSWLKTVDLVLRASFSPHPVDPPRPALPVTMPQSSAARVWLPTALRNEITMLLASLVLSTRSFAPLITYKEGIGHANER